jgi:hypothetical protein
VCLPEVQARRFGILERVNRITTVAPPRTLRLIEVDPEVLALGVYVVSVRGRVHVRVIHELQAQQLPLQLLRGRVALEHQPRTVGLGWNVRYCSNESSIALYEIYGMSFKTQ